MRVLNIQRMSTEDGPGLRTSVFLKGCPLHCLWCHNPESIDSKITKEWIESRCIGCMMCIDHCPEGALTFENDQVIIHPELCRDCFTCLDVCPTGAWHEVGAEWDIEALQKELLKDRAYFGKDGGITLTGGEVMMQKDDALALAKGLKEAGIHLCLDTCGQCDEADLLRFVPYIDVFLYDLKVFDAQKHRVYCGVDNQTILKNLIALSQAGATLWLRTPIIPGCTDDPDNIRAFAHFLKEENITFERWELMAFNNLCTSKYERLHQDWSFKDQPLIKKKTLEHLVKEAQSILGENQMILYTGTTFWEG
ncbi:MAG: glycyl-radical enzyme activating protein [Candidatus Izemoplasmatales bacterium]|nr:glycyl-radical enzyme activating protein [Candidatus Izemoplasmatales bacterium]